VQYLQYSESAKLHAEFLPRSIPLKGTGLLTAHLDLHRISPEATSDDIVSTFLLETWRLGNYSRPPWKGRVQSMTSSKCFIFIWGRLRDGAAYSEGNWSLLPKALIVLLGGRMFDGKPTDMKSRLRGLSPMYNTTHDPWNRPMLGHSICALDL